MHNDKSNHVQFPPNSIVCFDAVTLHSGLVSPCDIDGRIFIRVCYTAENVFFDL